MAIKITPEQREALGSLERQKDIAAISEGISDMEAGRVVTLHELDARVCSWLAPTVTKPSS